MLITIKKPIESRPGVYLTVCAIDLDQLLAVYPDADEPMTYTHVVFKNDNKICFRINIIDFLEGIKKGLHDAKDN